jgi:hypothetical protein
MDIDLHKYGQRMAKKYANEVSLLKVDVDNAKAMDLCCVCLAELEEYTSKKGNTYMANKGTAIIHFVYNTCCYSWGDLSAAKKIFEDNAHKEPRRAKNTSDYVLATYVEL